MNPERPRRAVLPRATTLVVTTLLLLAPAALAQAATATPFTCNQLADCTLHRRAVEVLISLLGPERPLFDRAWNLRDIVEVK
jgi:hypothetical protein